RESTDGCQDRADRGGWKCPRRQDVHHPAGYYPVLCGTADVLRLWILSVQLQRQQQEHTRNRLDASAGRLDLGGTLAIGRPHVGLSLVTAGHAEGLRGFMREM